MHALLNYMCRVSCFACVVFCASHPLNLTSPFSSSPSRPILFVLCKVSLTGRYILSELYSPGKSGSLFYYSQDCRFIIKTIRKGEHEFLRRILSHYHSHIQEHRNSLLVRFYGLHRVQLPHGGKIYFVVMGNIFPPTRSLRAIYDLKVSQVMF